MEFNILFLLTSIMTARFLEKRKMRAAGKRRALALVSAIYLVKRTYNDN